LENQLQNKMKNIISLLILLFFASCSLFSQEGNNMGNKGDWIVVVDAGFAALEAEDNFKVSATAQGALIGKEFIIQDNASIITGIGVENVRADFNDEMGRLVFLKNSHIYLPVGVRLFYDKTQKVSLFADLGIYGSYLLKSKVEVVSDDIDDSKNGLGFNFGIQASLGAKFKFINDQNSISIGLKSKTDMVSGYRNSVQEFKMTDLYVFQLGLNLQL